MYIHLALLGKDVMSVDIFNYPSPNAKVTNYYNYIKYIHFKTFW